MFAGVSRTHRGDAASPRSPDRSLQITSSFCRTILGTASRTGTTNSESVDGLHDLFSVILLKISRVLRFTVFGLLDVFSGDRRFVDPVL